MAVAAEIRFRERRQAPIRELTLIPAAFLVIAGFAVHRPVPTALAWIAAIVLAVFGERAHRNSWIEDYVLSEHRVEVIGRDGGRAGLDLADVGGVTVRGNRITLERRDGERLVLAHVRRVTALRKRLETALPGIEFAYEWDPLCRT